MRNLLTVAFAFLAVAGVVTMVWADDKKTISDVMKEAHVGGNKSLLFRIAGGKGEKEDAEKLLALYKDLAANKPPRGEEKAWKDKTDKLIKEAQAVVNGEEGAGKRLQAAANCMNCHKEHKPAK